MNAQELTRDLASRLERLAAIGEDAGLASLVREIRDERIPALVEGRMTVVVLGEFNHGKSSVINALLGQDVLPTGVTPTTSVITHLRAGTGPARVHRRGSVDELPDDRVRDLLLTDPPDDLQHVEIRVDSGFLAEGVIVVDTPGVNDISQQKAEVTYGYVPRADVVIYVMDATQALKRSEIQFIQERLLRSSLDRLFLVVNKADAVSPDELVEILAHVRGKLDHLLGPRTIHAISARRGRAGEDPAFDRFRADVVAYLAAQRAGILLDGAFRTGARIASMIDQNLAIEQGAILLQREELEKRAQAVREKLSRSRQLIQENERLIEKRAADITAAAREATLAFSRAFSDALPQEIERASTDDLRRYLPDFIHDTFREWLESEGAWVAMRLEQMAEEVIAITNENMKEAVADVETELGVNTRDLNFEVNTFGLDVGVFALGAVGLTMLAFSNVLVGGLLVIAAPVTAFVLKDRVDDRLRDKAREQGLQAIEKTSAAVSAEFERLIQDFSARLRQFVVDAGDRLYTQVGEALDRVLRDRDTLVTDVAPLADRLAHLRSDVRALRTEIDALRERARVDAGAEATTGT